MNKLIRRQLALTSALQEFERRRSENLATGAQCSPTESKQVGRPANRGQRIYMSSAGVLRHQGINE
jgi:hypothetical protein